MVIAPASNQTTPHHTIPHVDCPMGYDKYGHSPLTKRDDPPSILSLWIQPYLLRKYDWGMMTRGCLVPSQTVFGSIGYIYIYTWVSHYIYIFTYPLVI